MHAFGIFPQLIADKKKNKKTLSLLRIIMIPVAEHWESFSASPWIFRAFYSTALAFLLLEPYFS